MAAHRILFFCPESAVELVGLRLASTFIICIASQVDYAGYSTFLVLDQVIITLHYMKAPHGEHAEAAMTTQHTQN